MTTPPHEPKPQRLYFKTYLAMVKNAPGTRMFRHFFIQQDGLESDAIGNGQNACAFFVSSVLTIFQKANGVHGTIKSTIQDLQESGWQTATEPQPGDVLVWETRQHADGPHAHVGFYVGNGRAVSTSSSKGVVAEHDVHFGAEKRRLTATYRNASWD